MWSDSTKTALIIVPEEVEILIPVIRLQGRNAAVHLITYAAPVTKSMMQFNHLMYYTLPTFSSAYKFPAWFLIELGFFGGRLYVSFSECSAIKEYLCISQRRDSAETTSDTSLDGAACGGSNVNLTGDVNVKWKPFARNTVAFLLEWLALRRQVSDIMQTPMGYILQGRVLSEEHPFFSTWTSDAPETSETQNSTNSSTEKSCDDTGEESQEDDEEDIYSCNED